MWFRINKRKIELTTVNRIVSNIDILNWVQSFLKRHKKFISILRDKWQFSRETRDKQSLRITTAKMKMIQYNLLINLDVYFFVSGKCPRNVFSIVIVNLLVSHSYLLYLLLLLRTSTHDIRIQFMQIFYFVETSSEFRIGIVEKCDNRSRGNRDISSFSRRFTTLSGSSKTEIGCGWNICRDRRATRENAFLITARKFRADLLVKCPNRICNREKTV